MKEIILLTSIILFESAYPTAIFANDEYEDFRKMCRKKVSGRYLNLIDERKKASEMVRILEKEIKIIMLLCMYKER